MDLSIPKLVPALLSLLAVCLIYFFTKLHIARSQIWEKQKLGLVGSPSTCEEPSVHLAVADELTSPLLQVILSFWDTCYTSRKLWTSFLQMLIIKVPWVTLHESIFSMKVAII